MSSGWIEAIAVWVEALALVAIFIWDRFDSNADHKQTTRQLKITEDHLRETQKLVQSTVNAERAWIVAVSESAHPVRISFAKDGTIVDSTQVQLLLFLTNQGKTPARLESVSTYMAIAKVPVTTPRNLEGQPGTQFGRLPVLGADKMYRREIDLACQGYAGPTECWQIDLIVAYRDIFDHLRKTRITYTLEHTNESLHCIFTELT